MPTLPPNLQRAGGGPAVFWWTAYPQSKVYIGNTTLNEADDVIVAPIGIGNASLILFQNADDLPVGESGLLQTYCCRLGQSLS